MRKREMLHEEKRVYKSLFICGKCGKEDKKIQKVILSGYANMLCQSCHMQLEDGVADIARRYLNK